MYGLLIIILYIVSSNSSRKDDYPSRINISILLQNLFSNVNTNSSHDDVAKGSSYSYQSLSIILFISLFPISIFFFILRLREAAIKSFYLKRHIEISILAMLAKS